MRDPEGLQHVLRLATAPALLAACLASGGCAGSRAVVADPQLFIVVRHAEKMADGSVDPPLSGAGAARAQALADALDDAPLAAVYATPFRRTRDTAAAVAGRHGIAVRPYPAGMPAAELAARLRHDHPGGRVLVVGHSNTVPAIVAALCACPVAAMTEDTYGLRHDVRIDADGRATLARSGTAP